MPSVLDLFCGCGGISWGLAQSGFDIRAGVDFDRPALATYAANFPRAGVHHANLSGRTAMDLLAEWGLAPDSIDVLVGGPPCQGFSKNVPRRDRWLDDPKNLLIRSFLAFVPALRPRAVVIENVAEMLTAFGGAYAQEIREAFAGWGYSCVAGIHDASEHGVPQRRRRALFVAVRDGREIHLPAAAITPKVTVWDAIGDLSPVMGEGAAPDTYRAPAHDYQRAMRSAGAALSEHRFRPLQPRQQARYDALRPGEGLRDLPDHLRPKSGYSGAYGRLTRDMIAPTITRWVFHPGSGRWGHPEEPRLLTLREVARVQSFSDDYVLRGTNIQKSHQLGNAVPPALMHALAPTLIAMLRD